MTHILILGATGLVGQQVLLQSLASDKVSRIIAPTRTPLSLDKYDEQIKENIEAKLSNPVIDFEQLPDASSFGHLDSVICCLGTTMKKAGSKDAFRKVDYRYVIKFAKLAKEQGAQCFVLNSSLGANANSSSFYLKVKGDVENALKEFKFERLIFVRPSLLDGERNNDSRTGEAFGLWFAKRFRGLIPDKWKAVSASAVASVMLESALSDVPGTRVIPSEVIARWSV